MAQPLPNRLQSTLSTLLLLGLSFSRSSLFCHVPLLLAHPCWSRKACSQSFIVRSCSERNRFPTTTQRTVLVNGARMQKSLAICRTFARNGWRIVLVEEQGWGSLAAPRFSNSVSKFHLLPFSSLPAEKGSSKIIPYIEELVRIALSEKVDLFFPCSGAGSTGQDAVAAQILLEKTHGRVRSMIQTPELVEALHEKDRFISLLQRLDMAAPRSEIVFSVDEALAKLQSEGYPRSILKCAAELDDIGRADMTLYPLLDSRTNQPDWQSTRKRLSNLAIPLCARTPYILQEFIGDRIDPSRPAGSKTSKASEWCTHATVVDGKLAAFVCCPSNDMLMTYYPASHTIVGELALRWTMTFLYRLEKLGQQSAAATGRNSSIPPSPLARDAQWSRDTLVGKHAPAEAGITGQFSMDFIYQPATSTEGERLVAIECNPRVHTAICLLVKNPRLGDALVPASMSRKPSVAVSTAEQVAAMDELSYLSSLSLPVMESSDASPSVDLAALTSLPSTFVSSRIRFYHAKSLLCAAYANTTALPQSWIGHDLPARLLAGARFATIHPLWTSEGPSQIIALDGKSFDLAAPAPLPPFTDPSFAKDDPWPFFALYHLQWPQLLVWQLVVRRNKWSRINVSTARIFEC